MAADHCLVDELRGLIDELARIVSRIPWMLEQPSIVCHMSYYAPYTKNDGIGRRLSYNLGTLGHVC